MYTLPTDSELAQLVSKRVVLICCSANQVIFHFDGGAAIIAEAPFDHGDGHSPTHVEDVPLSRACVFTFLEQQVAMVEAARDRRDLVLRFSSGAWLTFKSDATFESFHVKFGEKTYPV